jgi:hypothetical protein
MSSWIFSPALTKIILSANRCSICSSTPDSSATGAAGNAAKKSE